MNSPRTRSIGTGSRSRTATATPPRASTAASAPPAMPPPTMTTSYISDMTLPTNGQDVSLHGNGIGNNWRFEMERNIASSACRRYIFFQSPACSKAKAAL